MSMSVKDRLQGKQLNYVKREVPAAPGRLIRLDRNENNIGYSPNVKRALEACVGDLAAYPDVFAAPLRSKLATFHGVRPEEILVGNGSFELINLICQVFLNPDDEVLFPDPTFEFYKVFGELAGGRVVRVPLEKHRVPLERLLERVTSRTRLVWICNPNNPTGTALGQEELTDFFSALPSTVLVVVDEAYLDFVREIQPPDLNARLPQFPNLVLLRTFSKAYGLAGARVGYAIANESVIGQLIPWKTPPNTNYPGTAAAAAALEDRAHYRHVVDSVAAESRRIYETLERLSLEYVPSDANFILFQAGREAAPVVAALAGKGILVRGGAEYGYPDWIRVTIGTEEENGLFLQALSEILGRPTGD